MERSSDHGTDIDETRYPAKRYNREHIGLVKVSG